VKAFPSEKTKATAPTPVLYWCEACDCSFTTPQGLRLHNTHSNHSAEPGGSSTALFTARTPTFDGRIDVRLAIAAGHVCVTLAVNGKTAETVAAEAEDDARAAAAARAQHAAEANRRRSAATSARVTTDTQATEGLQRRGSAHRHQYTPYEKVRLIEFLDEINNDEDICNKGEAFSNDARSRGAPYTTVIKWLKPDERRAIYVASSKMHAKTLLGIDKSSRQTGRYALMEKELFRRFKDRRARAQKTSARWIVHTARHLVKTLNPLAGGAIKPFKAGPGWLRRFARRWRICRRKKTNCKNTTWEETRPVLERYFRAFR
jgi:hypothetical protein